jgi:hypothetical protein
MYLNLIDTNYCLNGKGVKTVLERKDLTNSQHKNRSMTMSKKNRKNEVVATEVKNEAEVVEVTTDKFANVTPALQKGFQEALAAKIDTYIAREDSCAAAMTKVWFGEGLTYDQSIAFCVKWMADHKPGCTWGSKRSHIQAHRNWLRAKYWMNTEVDPVGRIVVVGQYEF